MEQDAYLDPSAEERVVELTHGVLRSLASTTTAQELLRVLVSRGVHSLHPVYAVIGRQTDRGPVEIARWGSGLPAEGVNGAGPVVLPDPCIDAINSCEPVWLSSAEDRDARYPELVVGPDVEALAFLPLVAHGAAFGVLVLMFARSSRFDSLQRAFLVLLADLCALLVNQFDAAETVGPRVDTNGHDASPRLAGPEREAGRNGSVVTLDARLTAREQEIAFALTRGQRSSAVARDLGISIFTVRKHISSILRKYDVTSQSELIARIYEQSVGARSGSEH
jgi:DNA-binding CsgD family transcriptional regulator